MLIKNATRKLIGGCGGLAATLCMRGLMSTLEYRAALYDDTLDPAHVRFPGPVIFLIWHEYIPFLIYLRGHCNVAALVSRHQDAEILSRGAAHMGFAVVRGSTNRGGVAALRELLRKSRSRMSMAITPDGPRGPRRRLAVGPIYLSSRLQIPLVPIGLGYDRPWRMPTWDRFAVPKPGSRARAVVSPQVQIPGGLGRDELEQYRAQVEHLLCTLTDEAEGWAERGGAKTGEKRLHRESRRRPFRRPNLGNRGGSIGPAAPPECRPSSTPMPSSDRVSTEPRPTLRRVA